MDVSPYFDHVTSSDPGVTGSLEVTTWRLSNRKPAEAEKQKQQKWKSLTLNTDCREIDTKSQYVG